LDLKVDEAELEQRRQNIEKPVREVTSPLLKRYANSVTSAAQGAVYKK
jgi:dihydroxy-acid dehydratase